MSSDPPVLAPCSCASPACQHHTAARFKLSKAPWTEPCAGGSSLLQQLSQGLKSRPAQKGPQLSNRLRPPGRVRPSGATAPAVGSGSSTGMAAESAVPACAVLLVACADPAGISMCHPPEHLSTGLHSTRIYMHLAVLVGIRLQAQAARPRRLLELGPAGEPAALKVSDPSPRSLIQRLNFQVWPACRGKSHGDFGEACFPVWLQAADCGLSHSHSGRRWVAGSLVPAELYEGCFFGRWLAAGWLAQPSR